MSDAFLKDLKYLEENPFKLPTGAQFDAKYVKLVDTQSTLDKVKTAFLATFSPKDEDEKKALSDLVHKTGKSLCFLYVYLKTRGIKDKLSRSKPIFDISYMLNGESLRDVLLTPGSNFFQRIKNLLDDKGFSVSGEYSQEIHSFFTNWVNVEFSTTFVCELQTAPHFALNSTNFKYNSYDQLDLMVCSIATALQMFYNNNRLIFFQRLSLFRGIMYMENLLTYSD